MSKDEVSRSKSRSSFGWGRLEAVGSLCTLVFLGSLSFGTTIEALQVSYHSVWKSLKMSHNYFLPKIFKCHERKKKLWKFVYILAKQCWFDEFFWQKISDFLKDEILENSLCGRHFQRYFTTLWTRVKNDIKFFVHKISIFLHG